MSDVMEAIGWATQTMRRREGLILVLTGMEREQKEEENKHLATLIRASSPPTIKGDVERLITSLQDHHNRMPKKDFTAIQFREWENKKWVLLNDLWMRVCQDISSEVAAQRCGGG